MSAAINNGISESDNKSTSSSHRAGSLGSGQDIKVFLRSLANSVRPCRSLVGASARGTSRALGLSALQRGRRSRICSVPAERRGVEGADRDTLATHEVVGDFRYAGLGGPEAAS